MTVARNLMRTQKTPDGEYLDLSPAFLLCGPSMEVAALQFTATTVVPTNIDAVVPVKLKSLEVVVGPRITDNRWYLAANPAFADGIEIATLAGAPAGTDDRDARRVRHRRDGAQRAGRLHGRHDRLAGLVLTPSA
jgi:hypothetical protein